MRMHQIATVMEASPAARAARLRPEDWRHIRSPVNARAFLSWRRRDAVDDELHVDQHRRAPFCAAGFSAPLAFVNALPAAMAPVTPAISLTHCNVCGIYWRARPPATDGAWR